MSTRSALLPIIVILMAAPTVPAAAGQVDGGELLSSTELPVSLERIRRRLDRLPARQEERDLLRLSYYIEVYGRAPDIDLLEGFDIHNGPVPYASSHRELLSVATPRHFRPSVANIGSVIGWAWKQRP